jgi:hypothetical protein
MPPSDEVKILEHVPKRYDLSDERFHYHWGVMHARIARQGGLMRRYTQHHRIAPGLPGVTSLPVEGVAEATFDNLNQAQAALHNPAFLEAAMDSMRAFMDLSHPTIAFVKETVLVDASAEGSQTAGVVLFLRSEQGLSDADFTSAFREHGEHVSSGHGMVRYSQYLPIPGEQLEELSFDAVEIMSWEDLSALERAWGSDSFQQETVAGLRNFCDLNYSGAIVTEARKII